MLVCGSASIQHGRSVFVCFIEARRKQERERYFRSEVRVAASSSRENGHGSKSKSYPPLSMPIPTKIGSKMGGEFTYPKVGSHWV